MLKTSGLVGFFAALQKYAPVWRYQLSNWEQYPYCSCDKATQGLFVFIPTLRTQLVNDLACKKTEFPEDSIMEYILGEKGHAILIRQNLLPDDSDEHFCWFFWHELGHFYAINSEVTDLHHYNDPGLTDDSHIVEFTADGPVLGLSDERLKQEGYWFWQEFIAEAISKYVSFMHRSNTKYYHPELMDWHPQYWGGIVDRLVGLLDDALWYYPSTIDEYALAHYFANLLMDDFIVLYVAADLNCPEMAGVSCPSVPTYSDVKPIIKHRI